MGQYHILCNLTKKQFVNPTSLGFGNKQREHTGFSGDMGEVLYLLTMVPEARGGGDILSSHSDESWLFIGSWLGDRVAVVGDYSKDSDLPDYPKFGSIYGLCSENSYSLFSGNGYVKKFKSTNPWRDITGDLVQELEKIWERRIIGSDNPYLWPDGTRRPADFIKAVRSFNNFIAENKKEV
jgi:hypothetical protein